MRRRHYVAADDLITQIYPNTTTAVFTYNAATQLTKIADKKASVAQWSYSCGPYGGLKAQTRATSTPFGFAGQYTDAETGLLYLRARY